MILFLDEERAYLYWATHHRSGYVLDCQRKPTSKHLVLHRASCSMIKLSERKKSHWTTGQHMKVCSLDAGPLRAWAVEQTDAEPIDCPECFAVPAMQPGAEPAHLTKLDKEILDFVLEAATLHLDDNMGAYWLSIGMVGKCLDKTSAQLSAALHRLVQDGLLTTTEPLPADAPTVTCGLIPTVTAMKTLASFAGHSDAEIRCELRSLSRE